MDTCSVVAAQIEVMAMRWLVAAIYGPLVGVVWVEAGIATALLVLGCILFLVAALRVDVMGEWISGWAEWFAERRRSVPTSTSHH